MIFKIKDKDDITRLMLEKMPEIDRQLSKLPNFEDNIKNLVIPTLNFYLNSNQFDVFLLLFRPRKKLVNNLERLLIN